MDAQLKTERLSDITAISAEIASINAKLVSVATTTDIANIEKLIIGLRGELTETIHEVSSAKVEKAMDAQHKTCALEFEKIIAEKVLESERRTEQQLAAHVSELHKRTSTPPSSFDAKKIQLILNALGPFLLKYVLPLLIGLGGYLGFKQIDNTTTKQDAIEVAPEKTEIKI